MCSACVAVKPSRCGRAHPPCILRCAMILVMACVLRCIIPCVVPHMLACACVWLCSDAKAKAEKRNQYSRHYAFKGRGRKEHLRGDVKMDRCELVPARG